MVRPITLSLDLLAGILASYITKKRLVVFALGAQFIGGMLPLISHDSIYMLFISCGFIGKEVDGTSGLTVGGSTVRPGKPFIASAEELKTKLQWPDIDSWDWDKHKKINESYLKTDKYVVLMFLNGFFERLISLMDFEGAVTALIDEDQKDDIKDFFDKLSDLYIRLFDRLLVCFPEINGFCFHDDWGAQKETFFSPATAEEMIVPYMKKITNFLHSKGKPCDLHSCGNLIKQAPNFIKAGWDSWTPQIMNDTWKIYDLHGDKLLISVVPEQFDPERVSEEDQRKYARAFAERFCNPEKPSAINMYATSVLTPAYREELYRQSRIRYAKQLNSYG